MLGGGAFVLRLAFVLVYGRADPPDDSINDTTFYQFTAAGVAHGHYTPLDFQPTAGWPPGFPFAVSVLYRAFGLHRSLALFLNVALATATVVLIYLIAERVFDRRVARVTRLHSSRSCPGPLLDDRRLPVGDHLHLRAGRLSGPGRCSCPIGGWKPGSRSGWPRASRRPRAARA